MAKRGRISRLGITWLYMMWLLKQILTIKLHKSAI